MNGIMNFNKLAFYVSAASVVIPLIGYLSFIHAQNSYVDSAWGKPWQSGLPRISDLIYIGLPGALVLALHLFLGKFKFIAKSIIAFGGVLVLLSVTNELFVFDLQHGHDAFTYIGLIRYLLVFILYVISVIYIFVKMSKH